MSGLRAVTSRLATCHVQNSTGACQITPLPKWSHLAGGALSISDACISQMLPKGRVPSSSAHTHVQPPACGFVCTNGAVQGCICPSHLCIEPVPPLSLSPRKPCYASGTQRATVQHAGTRGLPVGRGLVQVLLRRPLRQSFPPTSCAMSFSSKDSRRRLRLLQNSKCHGFRRAPTDRRPCPFASREPPPLARCTFLGAAKSPPWRHAPWPTWILNYAPAFQLTAPGHSTSSTGHGSLALVSVLTGIIAIHPSSRLRRKLSSL